MWRSLPGARSGTTEECSDALGTDMLSGQDISWVEVQLLVVARPSEARLWPFKSWFDRDGSKNCGSCTAAPDFVSLPRLTTCCDLQIQHI